MPDSASGPSEFARPNTDADLTPALRELLAGHSLSSEQAQSVFSAMMTGEVHHGEMGALLALLAARTPTSDEILGAARVMRAHVQPVPSGCDPTQIVDTAGTGGAPKTFNVSTAAAIIAAAAGATVAKHGNRSRTGRGSAEVLGQLGVNVDAPVSVQSRCLKAAGVCFCFAIHHHPATRHVMPVRMALGVPTIFNLLGPLTNPAGARRQIMGVYQARFLEPIAYALSELGVVRALVVHSHDGLDEISISAPTDVIHVNERSIERETIEPTMMGLEGASFDDVAATDLDDAARIVLAVLDGSERGPKREMTLINTAGTLLAAGVVETWEEGITRAGQVIDDGLATAKLQQLASLSQASS